MVIPITISLSLFLSRDITWDSLLLFAMERRSHQMGELEVTREIQFLDAVRGEKSPREIYMYIYGFFFAHQKIKERSKFSKDFIFAIFIRNPSTRRDRKKALICIRKRAFVGIFRWKSIARIRLISLFLYKTERIAEKHRTLSRRRVPDQPALGT